MLLGIHAMAGILNAEKKDVVIAAAEIQTNWIEQWKGIKETRKSKIQK